MDLNSRALSKIQSLALVVIILVAVLSASIAYFVWMEPVPSMDTIKIGVCGDLDNTIGNAVWQGAVLATEQLNSEGGLLGRNFEIVAEDDDSESSMDLSVASNALTRLITVDKADYIIASSGVTPVISTYQDICAQHEKILFTTSALDDSHTLRVLENYDRYKYYFRTGFANATTANRGRIDSILTLRDYTGFNKVGYLLHDLGSVMQQFAAKLEESLVENGFEVVYGTLVSFDVVDFTSYLAAVEESGAEILTTVIVGSWAVPLVREWYDRQSPFVLWGVLGDIEMGKAWDLMNGKCESVSMVGYPVTSGYPLTSKTMSTRDSYIERWEEVPISYSATAYDVVRFVLSDAIKRAQTTETEAVIEALEQTDVETSSIRRFMFTSNHDIMVGEAGHMNDPGTDYMKVCYFQWQNGMQVLVYPAELKEAGATYIFPDWPGPWDK